MDKRTNKEKAKTKNFEKQWEGGADWTHALLFKQLIKSIV